MDANRVDITIIDAALAYAQRLRWAVVPIARRGKKPLTTHGFLDASVDAAVIQW